MNTTTTKRADTLQLGDILIVGNNNLGVAGFTDITINSIALDVNGYELVVNGGQFVTNRINEVAVRKPRTITIERDLDVTITQTVTIEVPADFDIESLNNGRFDYEEFNVISDEDGIVETHEAGSWEVRR